MAELCPTCLSPVSRFPCPVCGCSPQAGAGGVPGGHRATGTVLQGRYRIVNFLAQGGMGAVYRAFDERLGQECILKELLDEGDPGDRAQRLDLFRQEAQMLAGLHHPHIASVWDFFSDQGRHYIAEELLPGGNLDQFKAPLAEAQVLQWAVQVAEALAYLHRQKIIYRDLKPDNILLRADGRAVMADFGIARFFKPGKQGDTTRFVTFGYAPLEQLGQQIQTTPASDVYAFGAVLYRLLTGKGPETWLTAQNYAQFPPLRSVTADVTPQIAAVAERCVRFKIAERYADGGALLEALRPLWLRWVSALCACGHQNRPGATHCAQCRRVLLKPQAWYAAYPGPFTTTGDGEYRVVWQTELGEVVRAHPLVWNGRVLVAGESGVLYELDMAGHVAGRTPLGAPSRSSPAVYADKLWTGTDRGLLGPHGLIATGAEVFAPPCGGTEGLYVITYTGELLALTAGGRLRWQRQVPGTGILPAVHTRHGLIAMTKQGAAVCFSPAGDRLWEGSAGESVYGWPAATDHHLVFLDAAGRLQVWDLLNGQRLLRESVVGQAFNGLARGGGMWVAADRQGVVVAMDDSYRERWRTTVAGEVVASPVVAGSRVIVGDRQGRLHLLDLASGTERALVEAGKDWVAPVVADGNALFGVTREGTVCCLVAANH